MAGDDPAGQLLAVLDVMDVWFNDPDFHGCMFMNTAAEFPNPHDPVHQAAAAHRRKGRDHFRDLARAAGAEPADAETFADCYTALIEGALILRQTHARNDAARVIRPAVQQLIGTVFAEAPGTAATRKSSIAESAVGTAVTAGPTLRKLFMFGAVFRRRCASASSCYGRGGGRGGAGVPPGGRGLGGGVGARAVPAGQRASAPARARMDAGRTPPAHAGVREPRAENTRLQEELSRAGPDDRPAIKSELARVKASRGPERQGPPGDPRAAGNDHGRGRAFGPRVGDGRYRRTAADCVGCLGVGDVEASSDVREAGPLPRLRLRPPRHAGALSGMWNASEQRVSPGTPLGLTVT